MTYEASHATQGSAASASGWILPVLGGGILTLLWGAYTVLVVAHIFAIPLPPYPG
jgi:hypothetical protein